MSVNANMNVVSSTSAQIESVGSGRYRVLGPLTFHTVRSVLHSSQQQFGKFARDTELEFDLGAVTATDSAGLSLLIEWYRWAAQQKKSIRFVAVPAQLRALAKISDIDQLLSL